MKAKFILSGTIFLIVTFFIIIFFNLAYTIITLLFNVLYKIINWLRDKLNKKWINNILSFLLKKIIFIGEFLKRFFLYPFYVLLFLFWLGFYVIYIFPVIPSLIGGGQPRSVSLLATLNGMEVLNSLEIKKGKGAYHQTENICLVHENSHSIYILRSDRVLVLDKSLTQGFASLPGKKSEYEQDCIELAFLMSMQGYKTSKLLFITSTKNLIRYFRGLPPIYFHLKFFY